MSPTVPNLILTGFMGTGKTAVGRELAGLLGRPFHDLDAVIEQEAGRTVAEIFAAESEEGFRRRERAAVARVGGLRGAVIATGGGTLLDPVNRERLQAAGQLILLKADPAALVERLREDAGARPLLAGHADLPGRLAELLAGRAEAYAGCDQELDTTGIEPAEAAAQLAARLARPVSEIWIPVPGAEGLPVLAAHRLAGSRVVTGRGTACRLGAELRAREIDGRVILVMPEVVRDRYLPRLTASLDAVNLPWGLLGIQDGDQEKTFAQVEDLVDALASLSADRGTCVVAVGGGVTGDLVGFAAAVYMRGIALAMVPTTLLAQVDAHIGGKTGVNGRRVKNLAGAFHPPILVVADPCLLATLPDRELAGGLAEVVKSAIIGDPGLFARLEAALVDAPRDGDRDPRRDLALLEDCVASCAAVKGGVVTRDPWELDERRLLNLGHTLGHALEAQSEYGLSHGEAVSIGTVAALQVAVGRRAASRELLDRTRRLLRACGLPTTPPTFDADDLMSRLRLDKKRRDGRQFFVLPRGLGRVEVVDDVSDDEALEALAREQACASS